MNKGYLIIEASIIMPLIIFVLILCISMTLFYVIRIDTDLDMNFDFFMGDIENVRKGYNIKLPLLSNVELEFFERKREIDYGKTVQRSKILQDIFED